MTTTAVLSRATYVRGALWGVFAISIWVGWIIFTRFGVTTTLTAYDITALRFTCAGLVMLPLVWREGWGIARAGWPTWLMVVCCAGAPYVLLASSGLRFAPAAHAGALVPGTMPLWAALLAMVFLGERISGLRRLGLMLIPVGIVIILGAGLTDFASGHWRGHLLFLSAAMTWASFTVAVRRAGLQPMHAAAVVSVVSMLVYVPIYVLFLPHRIAEASWGVLVSQTLYQGIAVSIVSLVAYARAVSILGASLGASFASLVPVMAMLGAIPLLGEVPAGYDYLGIAAVTCGVFLSSGAYQALRKR